MLVPHLVCSIYQRQQGNKLFLRHFISGVFVARFVAQSWNPYEYIVVRKLCMKTLKIIGLMHALKVELVYI